MRGARFAIAILLPLLACQGLNRASGNPTAAILAPEDGDQFEEGEDILLVGLVEAFGGQDTEFMQLAWSSDRDGEIYAGEPDDDGGNSQLTVDWLAVGSHRITLSTEALDGGTSADVVDIEILEAEVPVNEDPECAITAPDDGATLAAGSTLLLTGTAGDPDHDNDVLAATWSSSVQGDLGTVDVEDDGQVSHLVELDAGDQTLTLEVEDPDDGRCDAQVSVTVSSPPTAVIQSPVGTTTVNDTESLFLQGVVADAEEAPEDLAVTWTSSVSGLLGESDPSPSTGIVLLTVEDLAPEPQVLTLQVTDSTGLTGADSITVLVNSTPTAPVVVISPSDPLTDDSLTAVITTPSTDADGGRRRSSTRGRRTSCRSRTPGRRCRRRGRRRTSCGR